MSPDATAGADVRDHAPGRSIEIIPVVGLPEFRPGDDLAGAIADAAPWLVDDDILVVTSKIVSKAEGRIFEAPTDPDARDAMIAHVAPVLVGALVGAVAGRRALAV